jgi:hypothetical protein
MILKGANCTFSGIATMDSRRDQLKVNSFGVQEVFEEGRTLIVKALKFGT